MITLESEIEHKLNQSKDFIKAVNSNTLLTLLDVGYKCTRSISKRMTQDLIWELYDASIID